jgi:DNA invertase Pin-like site-specific DNA recombinase
MVHSRSKRVALYVHAATVQAGGGGPVAAQLAEMRQFAAHREWTVVAEFLDGHVAGSTSDRPGLHDLLAAAEERAFDVVLVHSLACLSQSIFDLLAIFESLGRREVGLASVTEPQFDLSGPIERPPLAFIADLGRYYDDLLRSHAARKPQRAQESLYVSIPHYGYRHSGDPNVPPVVVEEEAKAVRLVFERYATGNHSYQDIADELDEAGFRTRRGRHFSKDSVANVLRDPFYAGQVIRKEGHRGSVEKLHPGLHDAIVSEELWNACLHLRQRRRHVSRSPKRQRQPYLLAQIAHCHVCGRKLRTQSAASASYYRESSTRTHDDCPNSQIGVRAEVLHRQVVALLRELGLSPGWEEGLVGAIAEEEEASPFQNRRNRLVARRRRLKKAYARGDFEQDEDVYRQELARVGRALGHLPSKEDLFLVRQAAHLLGTLAGRWDDADPADLRDLLRLMLREVQVDVVQGRLLFLRPAPPFIPLFRSTPALQERDAGTFAPVWPDALAEVLPYPTLPPLTALAAEPAELPFLPAWPWTPDPKARVSPPLSTALKARRKAGREGGTVVAVPRPGVPSLLLDAPKWPEVLLEEVSLARALERPADSVAFLETPLAVQGHPAPGELAQAVFWLLEQEGYWRLVDVVPASMPAHWVFAFFPQAWRYAQSVSWTAYTFYNVLRRTGFRVEQREHTFHQPIALGLAMEIARQRSGLLALLPDDLYQAGLRRLEEAVGKRGEDTLVPSEVTVVEVMAVKGQGRPKKRARRKKRAIQRIEGDDL